ncbi:serine/threonine protein kinase/WD40 repeat protein [Prauserella sediminis]|uniref:non-specific serine/threonine protein kinase n=1 Tax=Prauserella sediminis TaxID=577680 RepID=A0A839XUR5_9PSEU|nr:serine/threonine-protein kinase [Prauserella sediminis]MBB3663565.1 serine/threonine protein kinase/WD40 repeat protein [Prauserella sediminis]
MELFGGRYRVGDLLGRGGMGEVYRAVDTVTDRPVALKLLAASADEHHAARLRREAQLAARLADPHIVEVYGTGADDDGRHYVAMRLVEGTDLRRLLARGPLEPRRALRLLEQVAAALDTAHAAGIVHRDVKPSNILIGPDDDAHLTDFGIARQLESDDSRLTRTGSYVGSLDYIAPEQLRGRDVTGAADVYALACVLYECLTGKVPFPADDPAEKLAAQLNDPPAAPSVFDPTVPPAFDMIVATGMDKEPSRRFATAGELLAAATAAFADEEALDPVPDADVTAPGGSADPAREALMRAIVTVSARRREPAVTGAVDSSDTADPADSASSGSALPSNASSDSASPTSADPEAAGLGKVCPYPGLRSFGTGESAWFHGRDAEITDLLVRLTADGPGSGPLVVVGASGAGKSSLLRAGLFPVLDEERVPWQRVVLTPGQRPVDTLAVRTAAVTGADPAALAASIRRNPESFGQHCRPDAAGAPPMIVVDQLEQLFTDGASYDEQVAFATALACARPAVVLLAVRADHVPDCIALEPLRSALDHPFVVGPLGITELRQAITAPARDAGLAVETGLVDRLIADAGARDGSPGEHGVLPRLAHALRETWNNRSGGALTLAGYQATGGVDRAVAVSADRLYQRLDGGRAEALRTTLLQLVKVQSDGGLARRRADRADVDEQALSDLLAARLAEVDTEGVRLSHDALLTAWPRLREWVEAQRQDILVRQRLDEAAVNWREGEQDRGDLYRGARLATALEWADGRELTENQRAFLHASRREQQRSTRRLRGVAAGLAGLLVVALVASALAVSGWNDADRQAQVALSRQLAAESQAQSEWDPVGARQAALRAWRAAPTAEARGALLSADALPRLGGFDSGLDPATVVDVSDDGERIAVAGTGGESGVGEVVVRDTTSGEQTTLDTNLDAGTVQAVRFSPDGSMLAVAAFGDGVRVWDAASGEAITPILAAAGGVSGPIAWHPDGSGLVAQAVDETSRIGVWDPRTGRHRGWLGEPADELAYSLAYDGSRLAVGRIDGSVALWDTTSGKRLLRSTAHSDAAGAEAGGLPVAVALSDDLLASASQHDNAIRLYDRGDGSAAGRITDRTRSSDDVAQGPSIMTFSGDGTELLTATGSRVMAWDPVERTRLGELAGGQGAGTTGGMTVAGLAVTADAATTVAVRLGGSVVDWRRSTPWYEAPRGSVLDVAFDPRGDRATAVDGTGAVHTWGRRTGRAAGGPRMLDSSGMAVAYAPDGTRVVGEAHGTLTVTPPDGEPGTLTVGEHWFRGELAISPDGSLLAAASEHPGGPNEPGRVHVWNLGSREPVAVLELDAGSASALAFSPDGSRLSAVSSSSALPGEVEGSGSEDGGAGTAVTLTTWSPDDFDAAPDTASIEDDITDAVYAPGGENLIAASVTGRIQVRDASDGTLQREFGVHPSAVRALELSPDGTTVATAATDDSAVRLWDLEDGELTARLTSGRGFEVNALAFSPDGSTLARAGTDTTVALWHVDAAAAARHVCRDLGAADAAADSCGGG